MTSKRSVSSASINLSKKKSLNETTVLVDCFLARDPLLVSPLAHLGPHHADTHARARTYSNRNTNKHKQRLVARVPDGER